MRLKANTWALFKFVYFSSRSTVSCLHLNFMGSIQAVAHAINLCEKPLTLDDYTMTKEALPPATLSEDHLHRLISTIPQQVWTARPDGGLDFVNQQVIDYFGKSILKAGWIEVLHPDDVHETILKWTRSLATGENYEAVFRLRRADGVYRWHIARASALLNPAGEVIQWVGTSTDITERKEAEAALAVSEAHLAAAQTRALIGSWELDLATGIGSATAEWFQIMQRDPASGMPTLDEFVETIHPQDRDRVRAHHLQAIADKNDRKFDFRMLMPDGSTRWIEARSITIFDAADQPIRMEGTAQEISDRKQVEEALLTSTELLNVSQSVAKMGGWQFDIKTNELFWTDQIYHLLDSVREDLTLESSLEFFSNDSQPLIIKAFNEAIERGQDFDLELEMISYTQRKIDVRVICKITRENNIPVKMNGIIQDISEQKSAQLALETANYELEYANRILEHIAHYDALTHLPNRVLLADRMQQAMLHNQRSGESLAVAFIDLDGFKAINDQYGHGTGDKLLITIARRMKAALRESDTLARIGGDEFVVVLTHLKNVNDCEPLLRRILDAAAEPVQLDELVLQVSASIGVTIHPQDGVDAEQLLRHADQAMYLAKQAGKNCYHLFDVAQDVAVKHKRENLEHIRTALRNKEFVLYYQPKVNMRTGTVVGAEALIRWQHPERGLLAPASFLPIIENHLLSVELGEWVIATALSQMADWQSQGLDIPISVNVGALQLQQSNFANRLEELLFLEPDANPKNLELEILETSALEDINQVSAAIHACQALGVSFALDDFGTGYSSLAYLKRLPAELLKIDQSFVRDMLDDSDDLAIIQGIIGLATAFQRLVIAEGVETVDHGKKLLSIGCELAQGYGIARPMPAEAFPGWVKTWSTDGAWLKSDND
ncbi:MAG: bifunctional diguanylate cyclase/phosphodiesterase [Gammaproteobacteria bacterium]|nr:MAG: bifunctional diguanylate cyclase/phosphodiesterase [Gammaproteobacteria bacterium]